MNEKLPGLTPEEAEFRRQYHDSKAIRDNSGEIPEMTFPNDREKTKVNMPDWGNEQYRTFEQSAQSGSESDQPELPAEKIKETEIVPEIEPAGGDQIYSPTPLPKYKGESDKNSDQMAA